MPYAMPPQDHYTRKAVLDFLSEFEISFPKPADVGVSAPDQRTIYLEALGIQYHALKKLEPASATVPTYYKITGIITMLLFLVGLALMFVDLFLSFTKLHSTAYIAWCLCCLSLYFTNRIALKDWKKHHEQK